MNLEPALDLIRKWEGIEDGDPTTVNLDPYLCPAGLWTIGWGHVVTLHGKPLKGRSDKNLAISAYPGGITTVEAEALLREDAHVRAEQLRLLVKVTLGENQFCALLSWVYNVGVHAAEKSTLIRLLNKGQYQLVPGQLRRWNKSNGKVLQGLKNRREDEIRLWRK